MHLHPHFRPSAHRWPRAHAGLLAALLGLAAPLAAVRAQAPAPAPVAAEPTGGGESEAQTIARCLADLRAPSEEARHRAVLLLGKYHAPAARSALVAALDDASPLIRRAALVALAEDHLDPLAAPKVLVLLIDADVSVRRLASYHVANAVMYLGDELGPAQRSAVQQAFGDPDLGVRKNMLQAYNLLAQWLPPSALTKLLSDPDREVRILALEAIVTHPHPRDLMTLLLPLASDPDRLIRLRLAQLLNFMGNDRSEPLLTKLAADPDLEIATTARINDCRLAPTLLRWQALRPALDLPALPPALAGQIVALLPAVGDGAEALLRALLSHPRPECRVEALRAYAAVTREHPDAAPCLAALADTDLTVRAEAARQLQFRRLPVTTAQVTALTASKYPDVRLAAGALSASLSTAEAAALLLDQLLDDAASVRCAALQELGRRRLPGWQQALGDSLRDPDSIIALQAVQVLGDNLTPDATALLKEAAKTTKDARVQAAIKQALNPDTARLRLPPGVRIYTAPPREGQAP